MHKLTTMEVCDELYEKFGTISAAFERLFSAGWSSRINVEPNSEGFTVDDVEALLDIAKDRRMDALGDRKDDEEDEYGEWDDDLSRPPVQALHAILRLTPELREQRPEVAKKVAQAMAARCVRTEADELMCDVLGNSVGAILVELHPVSLPYMLQELNGIAASVGSAVEAEGKYGIGTSALLSAVIGIGVETDDLAVARRVASGVVTFLDKLMKVWGKARGADKDKLHQLVSDMGRLATKLGPLLRNEAAIATMRAIVMGPHAATDDFTIQSDMDWISFLGCVGLQCSPADPALLPKAARVSQVQKATLMWQARRGDESDTSWPKTGPFPGEPGYKLPPIHPDTWFPEWCCGAGSYGCATLKQQLQAASDAHMLKWDAENPLSERVTLEGVKKAFDSKREKEKIVTEHKMRRDMAYKRRADELWRCSRCSGVYYCSETCQAVCYSDKSAKQVAAEGEELANIRHFEVEGDVLEGPLHRLQRLDFDSADQHKFQCKLLRAIWAEAGVALA